MLLQLILGGLACLSLVLRGVLALPLGLEHALAAGGVPEVDDVSLLLFRGDSSVAASLLWLLPNLNME